MCFSIFKKKVKPMLKSEMSSSEVWDLIRVMGLDIDTKKVNFADAKHRTIPNQEFRDFLSGNRINLIKWSKLWDCDDFSIRMISDVHAKFPGCMCGMVWYIKTDGSGHSINIVLLDDGIYFLEPQNDFLFTKLEGRINFMLII